MLARHGLDAAALAGGDWAPVLAIGSNASPEQLGRKFPRALFPRGAAIPVVQCVLPDFDVVYAPLVSSYGSCTATLEHSPGTDVEARAAAAPAAQRRPSRRFSLGIDGGSQQRTERLALLPFP